jgi:hypothetical protein
MRYAFVKGGPGMRVLIQVFAIVVVLQLEGLYRPSTLTATRKGVDDIVEIAHREDLYRLVELLFRKMLKCT